MVRKSNRRRPQACNRCQLKKIRCFGGISCTPCVRAGNPCTHNAKQPQVRDSPFGFGYSPVTATSFMEGLGLDKQKISQHGVIHESTNETWENIMRGDQQSSQVTQSAMYLQKFPCITSNQTLPRTGARSPNCFEDQQEYEGNSREEYQKHQRSTRGLDQYRFKGVGDAYLFPGENIWELPMSQGQLQSSAVRDFRLQHHDGDIGNIGCPCLTEGFGSPDSIMLKGVLTEPEAIPMSP